MGRDELRDALARVQVKPPRPLGLGAAEEERELLLEDHMAALAGPALWAGEQGLGDYPHPRDSLEQHVQERGDLYRSPRQRVY